MTHARFVQSKDLREHVEMNGPFADRQFPAPHLTEDMLARQIIPHYEARPQLLVRDVVMLQTNLPNPVEDLLPLRPEMRVR